MAAAAPARRPPPPARPAAAPSGRRPPGRAIRDAGACLARRARLRSGRRPLRARALWPAGGRRSRLPLTPARGRGRSLRFGFVFEVTTTTGLKYRMCASVCAVRLSTFSDSDFRADFPICYRAHRQPAGLPFPPASANFTMCFRIAGACRLSVFRNNLFWLMWSRWKASPRAGRGEPHVSRAPRAASPPLPPRPPAHPYRATQRAECRGLPWQRRPRRRVAPRPSAPLSAPPTAQRARAAPAA